MNVDLIDGTFELYRSFFAVPKATAPDGLEVGATRGVLRMMCRLLRDDVTHVAFSFDHVIESFRNDLFAGYKTGAGIEPILKNQFHLVEDAVEALGVVVWRNVEVEADDAIGTMALRAARDPRVERVIMRSPDKDLGQVVQGDRVVQYDAIRKRLINEQDVRDKFGVGPESIPDYLGLVGDSADGIPGIPRWGAKGTSTVLARYRHLAHIPADPDTWDVKVRGAKTLASNLEAQREDAALYVQLATLDTDVPLPQTVDDLAWRGADRAAFTAMAKRLGDERLVSLVPRWRDS